MEAIGRQIKLPISTAMQIALQGIKIRLGRAVVTITGVVLGIAFLMNVLAGAHISTAMKTEEEVRMKVDMMVSLVKMQIENPKNQQIAVLAAGTVQDHEREAIRSLRRTGLGIRAYGLQMTNVDSVPLDELTRGTDAVLIIGDGADCPLSAAVMTGMMKQKVILDTLDNRTYIGLPYQDISGARRELFFGKRMAEEKLKIEERMHQQRFRSIWIVTISLLVTIIGIANAMLMSVTERFKEIGTMKCLGALSGFIRRLFLIESAVIGVVGSIVGIIVGILFPMLLYSFAYNFKAVFGAIDFGYIGLVSLGCVVAGTVLSILAAIYPATIAARMIPAMALRTNV
jgi:hypothetical protein